MEQPSGAVVVPNETNDGWDLDEELSTLEFEQEAVEEMWPEPTGIGEARVDFRKIVDHFQKHTRATADALEDMIVAMRAVWKPEQLAEFEAVLDGAREHLAGYHYPMIWRSKSEAERYVNSYNRGVERACKRARLEETADGVFVHVPK